MKNKNLILDTNAIIYLYEHNCNNREFKEVDMVFLNNLVNANNCYITSVTINELLFRFFEENNYIFEQSKKKYYKYINFIDTTFINKNWYINDNASLIKIDELRNITESKYKNILENKRNGEKDYLYRIISSLHFSFINAYEEFLNRKINKDVYKLITDTTINELRSDIDNIINRRYSEQNYSNNDAKNDIDMCLYKCISCILSYLSSSYNFPCKEIQTWNPEEKERFSDILQKINTSTEQAFEAVSKNFSESKFDSNKQEEIIDFIKKLNLNNVSYDDLKPFIEKMKNSKYKDEENVEACFINLYDSPDYDIIKSDEKLTNKGAQYICWVCKKIQKQKGGKIFQSKIMNEMSIFFDYIKKNTKINYTNDGEAYFKFLLEELLNNSRRLDKNDVNDFLIVTAPGYIALNNVTVISYDKTIEKFLKSQNKYYDVEIYKNLRKNTQ